MPKPIATITADCHIAEKAWLGREIAGDAYASFDQITRWAVDHEVEAVILAGDVLERPINRSGPVAFLHAQLDRLRKAQVRCLYIEGNHDESRPPWLSSHAWPTHLHMTTSDVGDFPAFGLDYQPAPLLQTALAAVPSDTRILVLHQTLADFCHGRASYVSPQGSLADVPSSGIVVAGDYHVSSLINATGRHGQRLRGLSPGSTHMLSVDEDPVKYFWVLLDDGDVKRVKLSTRPFVHVTVDAAEDVDGAIVNLGPAMDRAWESTAGFDERIRKPILRVTYPYALADLMPRVARAVHDRAHLFWNERPPVSSRVGQLAGTAGAGGEPATLLSGLRPYLEGTCRQHLGDDCERLLAASDPAVELSKMWREVRDVAEPSLAAAG